MRGPPDFAKKKVVILKKPSSIIVRESVAIDYTWFYEVNTYLIKLWNFSISFKSTICLENFLQALQAEAVEAGEEGEGGGGGRGGEGGLVERTPPPSL